MTNPVETLEEFARVHRKLDAMVKQAIATPRPRVQITPQAYDGLKTAGRTSLEANNSEARIAVAKVLYETVKGLRQRERPIFWVTLVCREHAVPLSNAASFDVELVRCWVSEVMAAWSYLGMIEAGYYSNYGIGFGREPRWISWHAHLMCWGKSRPDLTRLRDETNASTLAFIHGRDAMHFYVPAPQRLPGLMLYAAKSPISDYRVFKKGTVNETDDGSTAGRSLEQRKRPLRPGDAVRTYNAIGDRKLLDLTISDKSTMQLATQSIEQAE